MFDSQASLRRNGVSLATSFNTLSDIVVMTFQTADKFRMAGGWPHRMVGMVAFEAFGVFTDTGMNIRKLPDRRPVHAQIIAPP
jgi:hypothetical protein